MTTLRRFNSNLSKVGAKTQPVITLVKSHLCGDVEPQTGIWIPISEAFRKFIAGLLLHG